MRVHVEDGIINSFKLLKTLSREVMMEQMSKAGNAVKQGMRASLRANKARSITRVSPSGRPYLLDVGSVEFGLRQSHSENTTSSPSSMSSFINSFLAEKSETLIVGGAHPRFAPILRRDGDVVGVGASVSGVGTRTTAILHRMDTGEELAEYNLRSKLSDELKAKRFMTRGISASTGKVKSYLEDGFSMVMERAANKHRPMIEKRAI